MSFFTRRARQETEFDRKVRAVAHWSVTPTVALISSIVACLSCTWIFVVVYAGLPRAWATQLIVAGLFIAPALAFVSARELWRSGWDIRLLLAALLSGVGFAFWSAAIYFVIYPRGS
jgi:hypothetical protein